MFRYKRVVPLLMAMFSAIIVSTVMAATKKSFFSVNDGYEITKDINAYASDLKIDLDTAIHRLVLQEVAGNLDAALSEKEDDSYAGLWIQHSPQFRVIVQFTQEGEKTIRPYIENESLADIVDIRVVEYTLKELEVAQIATQLKIRDLDIPADSGINVFENSVELYVVERSRFDAAMQDSEMQLPPQVKVVTVSELSTQETDIYAGLALSSCTSGFSVIDSSGVKGILTAAHCPDEIWYSGTKLPWKGSAYGGPCDFQWHSASGFNVRNLAYDGTYNRYIYSTKHRDTQAIGEWVCKHGAATGYTCGYIIDKNYNPGGAMDATLIRVHRYGVNLSSGNDSGAPWFFGNTAYGVHIGGIGDDAYYMAINYIDFLDLSVLTTNTAHLPLVLTEQTQSQSMTNLEYGIAYPSPNDDGTFMKSPSSLEPYPYP